MNSAVNSILRTIIFVLMVSFGSGTMVQASASTSLLDTGFTNPKIMKNAAAGTVYALAVQSDGKILVGGDFNMVGTAGVLSFNLARFNADGTLDTGFDFPGVQGIVYALALDSDGKILVGGSFVFVGSGTSTVRGHLARFNTDGTLDTGFSDPNVSGIVYSIAVQSDGKILAGGMFTMAGSANTPYGNLARFNTGGTLDSANFGNPALDAAVYALAVQSDGKILAGGAFTTVGVVPRNRMARFTSNGTLDTTFADPNLGNTVRALALQTDGKILAGGNFQTAGSGNATYDYLARFDSVGVLDGSFGNPGGSGTVYALTLQRDDKILVAGDFGQIGGIFAAGAGRLKTDGTLDSSFPDPNLTGRGSAIKLQSDGNLLVGGSFTAADDNVSYGGLARFFSGMRTLSVTAPANGSVTSSPAGITCGATFSASIGNGTQVTLTATPASGYGLASWGGDCSGYTNPLILTLTANTTCTATFSASGPPGPTPPAPPTPPPAFVSTPVPSVLDASTVGTGSGSFSFASSFSNAAGLTFAATQAGGKPLPSWLTFTPSTVSFAYNVPIPSDLPIQPVTDGDDRTGRADARASWANTVYPLLVRVAQIPVTLTAVGNGESYASTIQISFYAPRPPVAISAISLSVDGAVGNGRSGRSALSWDGGQMVFETGATNLFPASSNSRSDIVRYQALSGARDRLSQTAIPGGGVANAADGPSSSPAVSPDGRHAAFASEAPGITLTPTG